MDNILGKPQALKQVNLSMVRKTLREKGSATRAEIVEATKISGTTVRTLLSEMEENNEIVEGGFDESIGGRKAVRYRLQKNRFLGVVLCLCDTKVNYATVNICGEICDRGSFSTGKDILESVCAFLDVLAAEMEIRSIGIGVPGIVDGMEYQRKNAQGNLERYPIGEHIRERYGVPVLLENDLNATTLGFGRCYLKQFPEESCENVNMTYIYFEKDCISAGILSNGRILRGFHNFAGELGLYPAKEGRSLYELLASPLGEEEYAGIVARLIAGICCVLNPQYIAVGGESFRRDCLPLIMECFDGILPKQMSAEIVFAEDIWHDYFEGMAYLTAEQIFADVKLVRE